MSESPAAKLRSNIEISRREPQDISEVSKTRSRFSMEAAFAVRLIGAVCIPAHHKTSRAEGVIVSATV